MRDSIGSFIIYYGPGKGKTTSAIGLIIRAAGHEIRTSFIQFMKSVECGEHKALKRFSDLIDVRLMGTGFVYGSPPPAEAVQAAAEALQVANSHLTGDDYDIVVVDELLAALSAQLVSLEQVMKLVDSRPAKVSLVMTGREAPEELIARADLVSRIEAVKHPYDRGLQARPGIEY